MSTPQANNPLHGITLEMILSRLVDHLGWHRLGKTIPINCFTKTPTIKSSLKFLRKTPWAREKVEALYLKTQFPKKITDSVPRPKSKTKPIKKRIYLPSKTDE
ncbi:MAG: VF530 family protein [Thermodesulfobacteriota bacterium]